MLHHQCENMKYPFIGTSDIKRRIHLTTTQAPFQRSARLKAHPPTPPLLSPPSCGERAFTLKRWWNGVVRRSGLLRKTLAAVLRAAWSLRCPTANKHMRFHHPAVSKDPLNSGKCLLLLCSFPYSFSLFSLLYTNHLSFFI